MQKWVRPDERFWEVLRAYSVTVGTRGTDVIIKIPHVSVEGAKLCLSLLLDETKRKKQEVRDES